MFGPESTGKSTLGKYLAETFNTRFVPEYGRIYTEYFGADVDAHDLHNIVRGHIASVDAAKKQCNRFLIEDTDPLMTAVWSDMLLGEGNRGYYLDDYTDFADLYILCDIDIPWVDDGTRYFPDTERRTKFFSLCKKELDDRKLNYITVSGNFNTRVVTAVNAIFKEILP